jgi:hypothetical protein
MVWLVLEIPLSLSATKSGGECKPLLGIVKSKHMRVNGHALNRTSLKQSASNDLPVLHTPIKQSHSRQKAFQSPVALDKMRPLNYSVNIVKRAF